MSDWRALEERLRAVEAHAVVESGRAEERSRVLLEVLERLHDDDPRGRRELAALRASPAYAAPWEDPAPLVSVVIPTYKNTEALMTRSLPSALAQTHAQLEVIVVGDAAPAATGEAIATLGDPRVRYENLTYNGPYPAERHRAWLASGTPAYNHGVRLARGSWLAPQGDDDAFTPDHVERLLVAARETRAEYVYGLIRQVLGDGSESLLGVFPPRSHQTGLQAGLYLRGLAFLELEPAHALLGTPNDWGLLHRMLRIGVRMAMVDEVVTSYWPSLRGGPATAAADPAAALAEAVARTERQRTDALATALEAAETRAAEASAALVAAAAQAAEAAAAIERERERGNDLERRLGDIRRSKSWRLTAPLRNLRS